MNNSNLDMPISKDVQEKNAILKEALLLACAKTNFCPYPSTYYDASKEYGSDTAYFIAEDVCEMEEGACNECRANYFIEKAEREKAEARKFIADLL